MSTSRNKGSSASSGGVAGFLVGPAFFAMAIWFVLGPDIGKVPTTEAAMVPAELITAAPRRVAQGDPPMAIVNGMNRRCTDCHDLFSPRPEALKKLLQHSHIVLDHGINDACRNCHDTEQRDTLVLHGGERVQYSQVVRLCAKCHGPTYEDWIHGMHGRINGYWDTTRGAAHRLGCTECHDPHHPRVPAMAPIKPLPPPNTLRMGDQTIDAGHEVEEEDPLRRALYLAEKALKGDGAASPKHEEDQH